MTYKLVFSEDCKKQIDKLDNSTYTLLKGWIKKHLINCTDPKSFGKRLKGDLKNLWRYRIGNYRLIVQINDKELIILALEFGHRSIVYK